MLKDNMIMMNNEKPQDKNHDLGDGLPSGKLIEQWEITIFNR